MPFVPMSITSTGLKVGDIHIRLEKVLCMRRSGEHLVLQTSDGERELYYKVGAEAAEAACVEFLRPPPQKYLRLPRAVIDLSQITFAQAYGDGARLHLVSGEVFKVDGDSVETFYEAYDKFIEESSK